jgi:ABC-type transport system substrate-binding protein
MRGARELAGWALLATVVVVLGQAGPVPAAAAGRGGTLRVAMTAADIPFTGGQPDQGFEGYRFIGYQLYEPLIQWDLTQGDRLPDLVPGLAESWTVNPKDATKWTFKLRRGVKFHDGSDFNADAVLWNLDKVKNKDAPNYDPKQAGEVGFRLILIKEKSWRKIDDYTVEIESVRPSSWLPYNLVYLLMASPGHTAKVGRDAFARNPSGTGPFRLTRLAPRERAELEPFRDYWDKHRIPRADKVILLPMPEATTRLSALRAGQVDWIEVPPPDAIPALKRDGFQIHQKVYPHIWPYALNLTKAPWNNKLVRKAANYAIDREGLCRELLNGTCSPATGVVWDGHPWFGQPERYAYNPEKARQLLKEAGYPNGFKTTFVTSTAGSGQMQPLPMNEFIQKNLKAVGIDVTIVPMEWQAMRVKARQGFANPVNADVAAYNWSFASVEPFSAFTRFFHSASAAPKSFNVGPFLNPASDKLVEEAEQTFDLAKQRQVLMKLHELVVDEAPWIFVVHDLNPRAMSPKVKGFVQPMSWFVDLALPWVER